jgi:GNAT superfamily N-acetyltransferase
MSAQAESLLALCGASTRDGQVLLVQREGFVLGVAVLRLAAPDAEIVALVTDPNHRHRGVGRLLIRDMARRARIAGCSRLRIRLPRSDDAATAFFARLGFEDTHVAFDLPL